MRFLFVQRWLMLVLALGLFEGCVAQPMPVAKIQKKMIGTWKFNNVDGAPGTVNYPPTTYRINADSTCSQSINDKYREGTWKWIDSEDALVLYFDKGSPRAVRIKTVDRKTMQWVRVNKKEVVTFDRVKGTED